MFCQKRKSSLKIGISSFILFKSWLELPHLVSFFINLINQLIFGQVWLSLKLIWNFIHLLFRSSGLNPWCYKFHFTFADHRNFLVLVRIMCFQSIVHVLNLLQLLRTYIIWGLFKILNKLSWVSHNFLAVIPCDLLWVDVEIRNKFKYIRNIFTFFGWFRICI